MDSSKFNTKINKYLFHSSTLFVCFVFLVYEKWDSGLVYTNEGSIYYSILLIQTCLLFSHQFSNVTISWGQIKELSAALGPLSTRGEKYCSEACLVRYLEARIWNVDKSRKMLEESIKWRAAKRPEDIRWVIVFFSFSLLALIK